MVFIYISAVAAVVLVALIVRGSLFKTTSRTLYYENLPDGFDGFRIAVLSDLHDRKPLGGYERLARRVVKTKPDILMIPGDLHNSGSKRLGYVTFLEKMTSICPCYYVTGNHDPQPDRPEREEEYRTYIEHIEESGTKLLKRETVTRGDDTLTLVGTDWLCPLTALPEGFTVRLAHNPAVFDETPCADLTVCGHVHGGFMRLPFIGAVFAPGEQTGLLNRFSPAYFKPKYSRGVYARGEKKMVVSEGLGFTAFPPFRLIRGEVGVIILKKFSKNT